MGFFYLDSSVVVKRYVDEPGSAWVRLLVAEPENIVILWDGLHTKPSMPTSLLGSTNYWLWHDQPLTKRPS